MSDEAAGAPKDRLQPLRMTIMLPKPLGDRDLFDTGSLPIRRVTVGVDATSESE